MRWQDRAFTARKSLCWLEILKHVFLSFFLICDLKIQTLEWLFPDYVGTTHFVLICVSYGWESYWLWREYYSMHHQAVWSLQEVLTLSLQSVMKQRGVVKIKQEGWYLHTTTHHSAGLIASVLEGNCVYISKQNSCILCWLGIITGETTFISQGWSLWGNKWQVLHSVLTGMLFCYPHSLTYLNVFVCVAAWHVHGQELI